MLSDPDRPAGIFTPEQRRFIVDGPDEDLSQEVVRQRWYRIRRQVRNAFLDFEVLTFLPKRDQELIFEEFADADTVKQLDAGDMTYGLMSLLSLFGKNMAHDLFLQLLKNGMLTQLRSRAIRAGYHADVDIDMAIKYDRTPLEELREQYRAGEELSVHELASLVQGGLLHEDEKEKIVEYLDSTIAQLEERR